MENGAGHQDDPLGAIQRRLDEARKRQGWTFRDMAEATGLPRSTLQYLMRRRRRVPDYFALRSLVTKLGDRWDDGWDSLWRRAVDAEHVPAPRSGSTGSGGSPVVRESRSPIPRQLPAATGGFVGRAAVLAELDARLAAVRRGAQPQVMTVSTIVGPAGIGKTSLAVFWGQRNKGHFPDGQLYVDLRGFGPSGSPVVPSAALRGFLDALGVEPARVPVATAEQAALYRSVLSDKRVLVVLDNARDSDQVLPLLPGGPTCMVLVTSRNRLGALQVRGARLVTLDLLSDREARQLLAGQLGERRVAAETDAVAALVDRCGRLPLALGITAARAAAQPEFPLAVLVDRLGVATRLDALDTGEVHASLRAVFSWSYRCLRPDSARLFRLLGLLTGPDVGVAAVAALAGQDLAPTRALLANLVAAHLVQEYRPGRYRLHDLVRIFAGECLREDETSGARDDALTRVLTWYLRTADTADRILAPYRRHVLPAGTGTGSPALTFDGHRQALDWCQTEHANLVAAASLAMHHERYEFAWQLPLAMYGFYRLRTNWPECLEGHRVALEAVRELDDEFAEAWALNGLGIAHANLGRYPEAAHCFEQALALRRRIRDRVGEADTLNNLGEVWRLTGQYDRAIECHRLDYEISVEIGDRHGQSVSLNNLGKAQLATGQVDEALRTQRQALVLCHEVRDLHSQGEILTDLGNAHWTLCEHHESHVHYRLALTVFREVGDACSTAETLAHLAESCRQLGRAHEAAEHLGEAQSIADTLHEVDRSRLLAVITSIASRLPAPT
jgi:tetratricopeptide (TPR) repeat protein